MKTRTLLALLTIVFSPSLIANIPKDDASTYVVASIAGTCSGELNKQGKTNDAIYMGQIAASLISPYSEKLQSDSSYLYSTTRFSGSVSKQVSTLNDLSNVCSQLTSALRTRDNKKIESIIDHVIQTADIERILLKL